MKKIINLILILMVIIVAIYQLYLKINKSSQTNVSNGKETLSSTSIQATPPTLNLFDADKIASSETRMWKAYYQKNMPELGHELVNMLQEQFRLSPNDAKQIATDLSVATFSFQMAMGNYETGSLPPLRSAYGKIKEVTHGTWDVDSAASAELEWWVKRRTPGQDSQEEVGKSIARLYAILYGKSNSDIEKAGLLRAQAAHLRDTGGDWEKIESLLKDSYHSLLNGIQKS